MIMYMLKPTDFTGLKDLASEEEINKNPEVYDKLDGWNGIIAIFAIANTSESKLVDNLWYYYN